MQVKRNKGRPKGSYKFSTRQMNYFRSISTHRKVQDKWTNRIYKQRIQEAKRSGNLVQVEILKRSRKKALVYSKHGGIFFKQHWNVATDKDLADLVFSGKLSKDSSKLLILDSSNKAVVIAYAGDELFEEALEGKKKVFGTSENV